MMANAKSRPGGFLILTIATLVVVGLGLIAGTVYMWTSQTRGIADAFRPQVDSKIVLSGAIERLQAEGKLVVLTADVSAEARSSTRKTIFFDLVDLGETSVRVQAPARVQYVISLEDITRDDFMFDPDSRRLVLAVPNPRLDTTIVEVSTNPDRIDVDRRIGRFRLEAFSGRYNENRARTQLRESAIHAGRSGLWLSEAQRSARAELHRLLAPFVEALDEDVTLLIAFHDDAPAGGDLLTLPRPRTSAGS